MYGATVGQLGILRNPMACNQACCAFIVDENLADYRYLFYQLLFHRNQLKSSAVGAAQQNINAQMLKQFELPFPPLPVQQKIASILGALDDKIELNRRMNKTLEEIAQANYRHWFVENPEAKNWEGGVLNDIAVFIKGVSYSSQDLNEDTDTALVTLKSFERGGGYKEDGLKPYSGEYKASQEVLPGEVVIAHTDITQAAEVIGRAARVEPNYHFSKFVASLDLQIVRPKNDFYSNEYIFGLLSQQEFVDFAFGFTNGTTVLHLSSRALPEYPIKIPPNLLIFKYKELIAPVYSQITQLREQSHTLEQLRSILIPKLLSGIIKL